MAIIVCLVQILLKPSHLTLGIQTRFGKISGEDYVSGYYFFGMSAIGDQFAYRLKDGNISKSSSLLFRWDYYGCHRDLRQF